MSHNILIHIFLMMHNILGIAAFYIADLLSCVVSSGFLMVMLACIRYWFNRMGVFSQYRWTSIRFSIGLIKQGAQQCISNLSRLVRHAKIPTLEGILISKVMIVLMRFSAFYFVWRNEYGHYATVCIVSCVFVMALFVDLLTDIANGKSVMRGSILQKLWACIALVLALGVMVICDWYASEGELVYIAAKRFIPIRYITCVLSQVFILYPMVFCSLIVVSSRKTRGYYEGSEDSTLILLRSAGHYLVALVAILTATKLTLPSIDMLLGSDVSYTKLIGCRLAVLMIYIYSYMILDRKLQFSRASDIERVYVYMGVPAVLVVATILYAAGRI